MKKLLAALIAVILVMSCCSCREIMKTNKVNDNDKELISRQIALLNNCDEYKLKHDYIDTYFYKNGNVPLIDVNEFVASLDGFIDTEKIRYVINESENCLTQKWLSGSYTYEMSVYWDSNKIYVNDFGFFYVTNDITGTNYSAHHKWLDVYSSNEKSITFNTGNYYFDILYYQSKVLIPLPILNVLFCSVNQANLLYNGDEYHFYYGSPSKSVIASMRESQLNGTECPNDVRKATINGLLFTMDYFYGLKDEKEIDSGFVNYLTQGQLENLWSNDCNVYNAAYLQIFQRKIDELHTNLLFPSVYNALNDKFDIFSEENIGERWGEYYRSLDELQNNYKNKFGEIEAVRFDGKTAFIKLNEFRVAANNVLYDTSGNLKDDAWEYDTFYFMLHAMSRIKKQRGIENVVLDLTSNGGGTLGAMWSVLGFLTNRDIVLPSYNTLTKEFRLDYYAIDSDDDGDYSDRDAYTQYDWYVLTSQNTFSAANDFVSVVKNMDIATVIGERTGGGMCSVMYSVLADGTAYRFSSNETSRYQYYDKESGKNIYQQIESGIRPNFELDRKYFYDLTYINNFIEDITGQSA